MRDELTERYKEDEIEKGKFQEISYHLSKHYNEGTWNITLPSKQCLFE